MAPAKTKKVTPTVSAKKRPGIKRTTHQEKAKDTTTSLVIGHGRSSNRNASPGLVNEEPEGSADSSIRHADMPGSSQGVTGLVNVAVMTGQCDSPEVLQFDADIDYNCHRLHIAELEQQRLQNAELRKQIEEMTKAQVDGTGTGGQDAGTKSIPRPQGTAGTNFSIQEAMGLAGSTKKYETYKAIQVCCECRDPATIFMTKRCHSRSGTSAISQ
jgi:hypothetical protein